MKSCIYRGEDLGEGFKKCKVHELCNTEKRDPSCSFCGDCQDVLSFTDPNFSREFKDNLRIVDREKKPTHALRNILKGCSVFLVGGGPSADFLKNSQFLQRGVWSLGINNVSAYIRTNAFVCSDPPSKFHDGIWKDPAMMKFVPTPKLTGNRGTLRHKVGDEFRVDDRKVSDCPNVWGFGRRTWLVPDETFFLDPEASLGNFDAGVARTGESKTACTMLLGIRILYYLGARKIFLAGVDFKMGPSRGYCFPQERDKAAQDSNNSQYAIVNNWLCRLRKVFKHFRLEIFNCCEDSGLEAFPYKTPQYALETCLKGFPKQPFDLRDWYKK